MVFAFGVIGAAANAQVTYSSNFDPSLYSVGGLVGQDSWIAGSGTSNLPQVTNNKSNSPTQSVLLVGNVGSGSNFESNARAFAAGLSTPDTFMLKASAKIWVDAIGGADRYFGIGFGVSALATGGRLGVAIGGNGLRGGGGTYAAYNGLTSGLLQSRTTADFLGRWVDVSVVADRSLTTNNVVFTFGNLGTSGGSATETFTTSADFTGLNLSHIQVFSDWGSSSAVSGTAFIDDVQFQAVPEPATMTALGLGVAALLRRRKKA